MRLTDLTKPQWDAALNAARLLATCDPNVAEHRALFHSAKAMLVELLPAGTDASNIIAQAVRWTALNDVAEALAGLPITISRGEAGPAQKAPANI